MDRYNKTEASKALSRMELNVTEKWPNYNSLWCRIAGLQKEKWATYTHYHSFFELHLCLKGSVDIVLPECTVHLQDGQFLMIPPETEHRFSGISKDYEEFVWGIVVHTEKTSLMLQGCSSNKGQNFPEVIREEIDAMLHVAYAALPYAQTIIKCHQDIILLTLAQIFPIELAVHEPAQKKIVHLPNIKQYLVENMERSPTADEVAAHFFISQRQLTRICHQEAGKSYQVLKSSLRIKLIKQFIENSDMSFDTIATKVGFSNRYTMSRAFKRAEGVPPGNYRKALLK